MKRYFFFDIDGTLTTPLTADYPDSAREAVRRLQEKGKFCGYRVRRAPAGGCRRRGGRTWYRLRDFRRRKWRDLPRKDPLP